MPLDASALSVLAILLASLVLFVRGRPRHDVVGVLVVLALIATGAETAEVAFGAFGAPAVVTLGSMYVFSQALARWGLADRIGRRFLSGKILPGALPFRVVAVSGLFSTVVSDAAVTATLMPVVHAAARRSGTPVSRLLLPLAYGSLMGGTVTVVGTASNLALNEALVQLGREPFALFEYTPLGLLVLLTGALYFLGPGRALLPTRPERESLSEHYRVLRFVTEVSVESSSPLVSRAVRDLDALYQHRLALLGLVRANGKVILAPGPTNLVRAGDVLVLHGEPDSILALRRDLGLRGVEAEGTEAARLVSADVHLVEAVVPVGSELVGRKLDETDFRASSGLNVLAVAQHGEPQPARIGSVRLGVGDTLLVQGHREDIERARGLRRLLVLSERPLPAEGWRAWLVAALLAAVLLAAALGVLPISVCALAGAVLLVLCGCLRPAEALAAVDWSVLLLTGGLLALGRAFEQAGLGDAAAGGIVALAGGERSPHVALAIVLAATIGLTQITTNISAVVIMAPVAVRLAVELGVSPRPFEVAVVMAASCAFLSPVGHACNTMVTGPGGYGARDFLRLGAPLTLLLASLFLVAVPRMWPF